MSKILSLVVSSLLLSSCAIPPRGDAAEALCDREAATNDTTVVVRGTLWSDSHHGAYVRSDGCADIAWRLGTPPEPVAPSVNALLTDFARHVWPNGVTYRLDAKGHLVNTPNGRRLILSEVANYERVEK